VSPRAPFYPLSGLPQTSDLTRMPGRPGRAEGQVLNVMGRVLNLVGEPVRNAKVEVWQAQDKIGGPERQDLLVKKTAGPTAGLGTRLENGGLRSGALQRMIKD
jgi:Dioxygenase